jgi:hypothetical protein
MKFKKYLTEEQRILNRVNHALNWQKTPHGKFNYYKQDAKKRNLAFDLSKEDFIYIVGLNCFYCGDSGYGIDRLVNNIGYIKFNCVPCCTLCNKMKSNRELSVFINQCHKISHHYIDNIK